jgi:hypothetical protein
MKSRHLSIPLFLLLLTLCFVAFSPLLLQPTVAAPRTAPDSHLALTVMPDTGLELTAWMNTPSTDNGFNGSLDASLQVAESQASVNTTLALEDALFAEYPFNVTTGQLAVALSEDETAITLDLATTAPPPALLSELLPDADLQDLFTTALNSTDFALEVDYASDIVHVALDTTVTANLTTLLSDALGFPFGISTPLLLHVKYTDPTYTGNLTVVVVPGLPVDITLTLAGNASDLCIQSTLYVPYGTYPELGVIDASTLDDFEQYLEDVFPAAASVEGSLQNLTEGALTSPRSVLDREVIADGEYLNVTLCLHAVSGDLFSSSNTGFAAPDLLGIPVPLDTLSTSENPLETASLAMEYYPDTTALSIQFQGTLSPLTLPIDELLPSLLAQLDVPDVPAAIPTQLPVLEHARFALTYTAANQRLHLQLTATLTEYDAIPTFTTALDDLLPPSIAPIVTTPTITVTGVETLLTYTNSTITASMTVTWDGNVNHDVNRLKNALLPDITHLSEETHATLNRTTLTLTGVTGQLHLDPLTTTTFLTGLHMQPPIDAHSSTTFRLTTFLDAAHSLTPDERIPQLSLLGGCNGTHTVTLVPDITTPSPHSAIQTPDSATVAMTWRNVTLHDLRNVTFHLIDGVHCTDIIVNPTLVSPSSPHVFDAVAQMGTKLTITELSDSLALTLSPLPSSETLTAPPASAVTLLDTPIQLTPSLTPDVVTYTLQMTYTDQQVRDAGLDETTLTIQYWNATSATWTHLPTRVDSLANTVETTLTHFSIFTLTGTPVPLWTQPWFLALLACAGITATGIGLGLRRRFAAAPPVA